MSGTPWRRASSASAARVGRLDEALLSEVRSMDAQDEGGPAVLQRLLVVGSSRPIGGPDLDEASAGAPDDLGDPHAAADLDELAARDDHASPPGQAGREGERRGVVVGHQGVLGAGEGDEVVL